MSLKVGDRVRAIGGLAEPTHTLYSEHGGSPGTVKQIYVLDTTSTNVPRRSIEVLWDGRVQRCYWEESLQLIAPPAPQPVLRSGDKIHSIGQYDAIVKALGQ